MSDEMRQQLKDLIEAETMRNDFNFICEVVQRGRAKPKKYRHYITLPRYLYKELRLKNVIDPEDLFIDETAFFEFSEEEVTISFITLYGCEDLHRKIDRYLIIKFAGSYPLRRGGVFF
jgi:hypothetical protein